MRDPATRGCFARAKPRERILASRHPRLLNGQTKSAKLSYAPDVGLRSASKEIASWRTTVVNFNTRVTNLYFMWSKVSGSSNKSKNRRPDTIFLFLAFSCRSVEKPGERAGRILDIANQVRQKICN